MDKIYIEKLEVFAHHGVYAEETRLGQKFVLSLTLLVENKRAGYTDALEDTINYGAVARRVTERFQRENYKLLERAAQVVAEDLLAMDERIREVTVRLSKPWAPIGLPLETVGVEITRGWKECYLALGSNLGDKKKYLEDAVEALKAHKDIVVEEVSDWIETAPYGVTDQPAFLNGCLHAWTTLEPEELLDVTQSIEAAAKRERLVHWGPRTLDLDILFFEDRIMGTKRLILPHPEIEKRQFVLEPMVQIAPWYRHPVSKKTMSELFLEWKAQNDKEMTK